jgi:hypothetical protein
MFSRPYNYGRGHMLPHMPTTSIINLLVFFTVCRTHHHSV